MPIYRCPKCGRTIELPEGKYYCKVCGPTAIMVKVDSIKEEIKRRMRSMLYKEWKEHEDYVIRELVKEGYPEPYVREALKEVVMETTGRPL